VIENAQGITLLADLPGVPKEKLELNIEGETVTIEGELALDVPEGLEVTHAEVSLPRFRRVVSLPDDVDPNGVTAKYRNGLVHITVRRREASQPRRIDVQ
jgi:HSP20 family molecular chaperone IbpA